MYISVAQFHDFRDNYEFLMKTSENQDEFLKSLFFDLQKCVIHTSKESSEKSSFNSEIIFEVFL